jgi:WD40 repeat protein
MRTTGLCLAALCLLFHPFGRADGQDPVLQRLGSEDLRQPDARAALYTPDGRLLVTAGLDIRVWDARTRRLVRKIQPDHDSDRGFWTLRLSGDGKTVCGQIRSNAAVGYDLASGKQLFRIHADGVQFSVIDVSHDGKTLATGTCNNEMIVWDTATGKKLQTLEGDRTRLRKMQENGHALQAIEQPVGVIALSPDGKWLAATALYDWTLRVYDLATGREKHAFPTNNPSHCGYARFSTDSKYLAMSRYTGPGDHQGSENITIWDLATGKVHQEFDQPAFFGFAMSPDWKWFAADGMKGEVNIRDRATGKSRISLPSNPSIGFYSLAFSPDGDTLVSCGPALEMWELKTGRELLGDDGHTGAVSVLDISPDGKTIASGGFDGNIFLWDARTGKVLHRIAQQRMLVTSVAFSPDSQTLATCYYPAKDVVLWDARTGKEVRRIALDAYFYVTRAVFSRDGKTLAVGTPYQLIYQFFDPATGKERQRFSWFVGQGPGYLNGAIPFQFSPNGKHFAGIHARQANALSVALWDMKKKEPQIVSLETDRIADLAFSPDGEYLAWADPKDVHVWDVRGNCKLLTLKNTVATCVAFTPDGHYLAAGKKLHPLDPKLPALELPMDPSAVAFSIDGRIAAAVGQGDCTVLVLDAKKLGKDGK